MDDGGGARSRLKWFFERHVPKSVLPQGSSCARSPTKRARHNEQDDGKEEDLRALLFLSPAVASSWGLAGLAAGAI